MEENNKDTQKIKIVDFGKEPWYKMVTAIVSWICSIATVVVAIVGIYVTIPNVIQNSNTQKQTQVVIEPREGDIIVKDSDDYKLLQLISTSDVAFPSKIQEVQYKAIAGEENRVDINNTTNDDWTTRDSFVYIINNFSINANKIINLLENIESIKVYCDFYTEKNISTFVELENKAFTFDMWRKEEENEGPNKFDVTQTNIRSQYKYVTNEGLNDGIEWMKVRVEIIYAINNRLIKDTITSDWIETAADYFGK